VRISRDPDDQGVLSLFEEVSPAPSSEVTRSGSSDRVRAAPTQRGSARMGVPTYRTSCRSRPCDTSVAEGVDGSRPSIGDRGCVEVLAG